MEGIIGFVAAGVALAGSPGPATLSLAATGAAFGAFRGLGYMWGIIAGMVAVIAVTASGVTGILTMVPGATPVLASLAALYIAYLAYRIASAPPLTGQSGTERQPSFIDGFILSLVNPKGYAAMAALFSGFVLVDSHPTADAALKLAILVVVMIAVDAAWLLIGAGLTRAFSDRRLNRVINIGFAILLVASVGLAFAF